MGGVGGLGLIIMSNLNRVRLSCYWVGVGLGCDNMTKARGYYELIGQSVQSRVGGLLKLKVIQL